MTELAEPLALPNVDARIEAREYSYGTNRNFEWRIWIHIPGYDGRYNPGYAWLYEEEIDRLIDALKNALERMEMLVGQSFSGTFTKDLLRIKSLKIEVKASSGRITTEVILTSSTNYIFRRSLSPTDVAIWITKLQEAKEKGRQMLQTLQLLV